MISAFADRLLKALNHGFGSFLIDARRARGTVKLLLILYIAQMVLGLGVGFLIPILRHFELV
jgi:hypothetical protein